MNLIFICVEYRLLFSLSYRYRVSTKAFFSFHSEGVFLIKEMHIFIIKNQSGRSYAVTNRLKPMAVSAAAAVIINKQINWPKN